MTDMELAEEIERNGLRYFAKAVDDAVEARDQIIAALRRGHERVVYQCPRCATSMEVDPTAKPSERPLSGEMVMVPRHIHPMDNAYGYVVIKLLANPPSAEKFDDPNDYYDYWWKLLLSAAEAEGRKG